MRSKTCKWFQMCPIKSYSEQGRIDKFWVEEYCKANYLNCVRYHHQENNIPHPDYMLPNGEINENIR